jgi:SAM-dependent methyltransferase
VLDALAPACVLDLGCGSGVLLARLLALTSVEYLVGVDVCPAALEQARQRLARAGAGDRVRLVHASFTRPDPSLRGFDAAVLLEAIEHVDPERLSIVETALFRRLAPASVIVTTPNRDFNPALGVPDRRLRHPEHRFEWTRAKFESWCRGVARRTGYTADFRPVGPVLPGLGGPTQMAVFTRAGAVRSSRGRRT